MSVLIKGITLDDFIRYGGEYAGYLDGIGCTVELPDHGDLLDKDELSRLVGESFEYFLARLGLKCPKTVIPAERSKE